MDKFLITRYFLLTIFSFTLVLSTSCNKDDDDNEPENEQELITTVTLTFVNSNNVSSVFKWADPDGPGGNAPEVDIITLDANETYQLFTAFLDESDPNDVEDITEEVREEAEEHLLCFEAVGLAGGPTAVDTDSNGDPLGLQSELSTGDPTNGNLTVILKHEPEKGAATPCSTGETDVEVTFSTTIQ